MESTNLSAPFDSDAFGRCDWWVCACGDRRRLREEGGGRDLGKEEEAHRDTIRGVRMVNRQGGLNRGLRQVGLRVRRSEAAEGRGRREGLREGGGRLAGAWTKAGVREGGERATGGFAE